MNNKELQIKAENYIEENNIYKNTYAIEKAFKDGARMIKALHIGGVVRSADVNIVDSDIATIEALHDLLLDAHGYSLDFRTLKKARELTNKMYKALY